MRNRFHNNPPRRYGLVGGGATSQIGDSHRGALRRDSYYQLVAGAFDIDVERGRQYGESLGLASDRTYADYQQMAQTESAREVATHRKPVKERHWRSREDPFASVWEEVKSWLEAEPDATAKALFFRLMDKYPNTHNIGQLRTLQRRVKDWRRTMARRLIFGVNNDDPPAEHGAENVGGSSGCSAPCAW